MALVEFKDFPDTSTKLDAENLNKNFKELNNRYWKDCSWNGTATGGTITVDVNLRSKLVDFEFQSTSNSSHRTHCFCFATTNNYLIGQMYNNTIYASVTNLTGTSFLLTITSPNSSVELKEIHYLDIPYSSTSTLEANDERVIRLNNFNTNEIKETKEEGEK